MSYVTVGGAKSSCRKPRYHKIPIKSLERLAMRFGEGEKFDDPEQAKRLNGASNWQSGDEEFWVERYNHAVEHLLLYATGDASDDHLAAVMWYCAARMAAEPPAGH